MANKKMTPEVKAQKRKELVSKMRKLFDMVQDVNDLSSQIGIREKIINNIRVGVSGLQPTAIVGYMNNRFNMNIAEQRRHKELVFARQITMYLLKKFTRLSLNEIAEYTGVADHTTVIHGVKRLNDLMDTEEVTRMIVEECENDIYKTYKDSIDDQSNGI